jgi:hypothetical protein
LHASKPKVLAYYFPNYHVDPRNERWFGAEGWTEWDLVRAAGPRFPGHVQPRVPLLGERDESDPEVAAHEIELATSHGVDGFIFDYYWYEDGPFLEGALERGFMKARNFDSIDFSIMWANHDYLDIFPSTSPLGEPPLLASGEVKDAAFDAMSRHIVTNYFSKPNYSRVAGRPRFSIYEIGKFIKGMGGFEPAVRAIERLDALAREHGHPGIHLDVVVWGFAVLSTDADDVDVREVIERFGVGSVSSYTWIHHVDVEDKALENWDDVRAESFRRYEEYRESLPVPFYPNVSVGWDSSPRTQQSAPPAEGRYPWVTAWPMSVDAFAAGLRGAKEFVTRDGAGYSEVTINAWNEWTEGSYLLPDEANGYAFLEAVKDVFGAP